MTKICVFGAGAIGGYLAGALSDAGAEVSLIARGPHLAAIRELLSGVIPAPTTTAV